MHPEISVQVPVKNGGSVFRRFLRSLAAQDISRAWELIIADDGSTIPVEKEFAAELADLPDRCSVRVLRIDPGGVRPVARNAAAEVSESPVAMLMDADLEFAPSLLRMHLETRRTTGADVVMGRRINAWSENATPWQRWFDTRAMGNSPAGDFPWKYFITGNLSISSSLLRRTGGFDEAIDRYGGEDTELGYRLSKLHVRFYWEPSLAVNHLDAVSVRRHSEKMLEYGATGLKYTLEKHPGARGLLGSKWVEPVFAAPVYLCVMRLLTRAALSAPFYRAVLRHAEKHGGPPVLFTYLSVGAVLMGLRGGDFHR